MQLLALVASGSGVLGSGAVLALLMEFGPHARHMAVHILVMNVAAPLSYCSGLKPEAFIGAAQRSMSSR